MTSPSETKTCRMCCMEIAAAAKKCPFCHHWQNKFSMITFHPAFAVLLTVVPTVNSSTPAKSTSTCTICQATAK